MDNNNIKDISRILSDAFWHGPTPTDANLKILHDAYNQPNTPERLALIKSIAQYEFIQANERFVTSFKQKFPPADAAKLAAAKAESERVKNNLSLLDQADKSLKQNIFARWKANGIPRDVAIVLFDQISHQSSAEMERLLLNLKNATTPVQHTDAETRIMDYFDKEKLAKLQVATDALARVKSAETAKKGAIDALVVEINNPETK